MAVVGAASYASVAKALQGRLLSNLWRQSCLTPAKTGHLSGVFFIFLTINDYSFFN
jgi:hypothetical protein